MERLLEVNGLKTQFNTDMGIVRAVDGVSFSVDAGEIVGVVGESGCGKTVSALSIMRLVPDPPGKIVGGQVIFENENLLDLSGSRMRDIRGNKISMIFQEPMTSLNPVLTIGRQITESVELHLGMSPNKARRRAKELLEMVGFSDADNRLQVYPHQLSGGMRQRVMIAIAISCDPKLILADEPTTALDVTIQAQILELMRDLTTQLGTAMVIITHNLGIIARYASRVMVMYAGKVIEEGTSNEIYGTPRHPYTVGLLKSVPRLDISDTDSLDPIKGLPPDLIELLPGCSFAPRCNYAEEKCYVETPSLMISGRDHRSACWRWEEIPEIQTSDNSSSGGR